MKQYHSGAAAPAPVSGLDLKNVWHVFADRTYDIRRDRRHEALLIAILTHAGRGRLYLDRREPLDVLPGTLLLVENQKITRYHRAAGTWHFWWFEFTVSGPLQLPLERPIAVAADQSDRRAFRTLFRELRHPHASHRLYASALFLAMLNRWMIECRDTLRNKPHQQQIERLIDRMHAKLADNWTVAEMAAKAHMSERLFRKAFEHVTGQSPKRFYDRLRVRAGAELLKLGMYNVGEVADQLAFSSPFHFSKAFRRHFGIPPSAAAGS